MAFPTIAGSQLSNEGASVTAHDVAMPASVAADDILLAVVFHDGNATWTADTGNGWAILASGNIAAVASMAIAWKRAAGGETTTVVTSSAAERSTHIAVRIAGAHTSTNPAVSAGATGTSTTPNPDALNPAGWDVEDTLWLAVYGIDSGAPSAYPLPDNNIDAGATPTSAAYGGLCSDELAQASLDPGTFTNTTSDDWRAYTIAIRPAPAGSITLAPAAASLAITSSAPAVTVTDHKLLTPAAASLAIAGQAPAVKLGTVLAPAAAAVTLSSSAPLVRIGLVLTPAAATLAITGQAPTVTISGGGGTTLSPARALLTITSSSPGVTVTAHKLLTPAAATLVIAGQAPAVKLGAILSPIAATLAITGQAPAVIIPGAPIVGGRPPMIAALPLDGPELGRSGPSSPSLGDSRA